MFARLDDEIMRCKNRLKFLARVTVPSASGGGPSLAWNDQTLKATLNGVNYTHIRFMSTENELRPNQRTTLQGRPIQRFQTMNSSATHGDRIMVFFQIPSPDGGIQTVGYVLSTQ
jgi:hypothetical protein